MKYFRALLLLIFAFFPVSAGMAQTREPENILNFFVRANEFYHRGEYNDALELYQKVAEGNPGASIYYNMGNCYFRLNQIGKSIVYYSKALRLDPRDSEIRANLRYAKEEAKDEIENKKGTEILKRFFFWYDDLTWRETATAATGLYALLLIMAAIRLFKKFDYQGLCISGLGLLFLFITSSAGFKVYHDHFVLEGAIAREEVAVHSAADANSVILFKLHDGAEFRVLAQQGEWVQIELKDLKKGWVARNFTDFI